MVEAYCCKCKCKQSMKEGFELTKTSRGVDMVRGNCLVCGGKMCKIGVLK